MRRRFRRRPAKRHYAGLLLLLVIAVRLWQSNSDLENTTPENIAEGVYRVRRVVDGDTLIVSSQEDANGRSTSSHQDTEIRVRLLGVDTPETVRPNHPIEPWGLQATDFTKQFVSQGQVTLRFGPTRKDQYGRILAYVFVDELMLNEELARAGLAQVKIYSGEASSLSTRLRVAEAEARQALRGIWSAGTPSR